MSQVLQDLVRQSNEIKGDPDDPKAAYKQYRGSRLVIFSILAPWSFPNS